MANNNPILRVRKPSMIPGHSMYRDSALPGREYSYIALFELAKKLMPGMKPEILQFDDICAKPGNWFGADNFSGPRYEAAETKYPGIVIRDMPNPCDRTYRMVDGRRRMEKLRRSGDEASYFYVLDYADCTEYIFDFLVEETS